MICEPVVVASCTLNAGRKPPRSPIFMTRTRRPSSKPGPSRDLWPSCPRRSGRLVQRGAIRSAPFLGGTVRAAFHGSCRRPGSISSSCRNFATCLLGLGQRLLQRRLTAERSSPALARTFIPSCATRSQRHQTLGHQRGHALPSSRRSPATPCAGCESPRGYNCYIMTRRAKSQR